MQHERIHWVDTLKGIGIILVILGHTPALNIKGYIFSFHMPLFFFISGYLFQTNKYPTFINFLNKKGKSLLIPYLAFSVISILANSVLSQAHIDIKPSLKAFFISTRNQIPFNEALWFLTCIFIVEVMFYLISRVCKYDWLKLVFAIVIYLVGFKLFNNKEPQLPWNIDSAMTYLLYFALGYVFKKWNITNLQFFKYASWFCLMITFVQIVRPDVFYIIINKLHISQNINIIFTTMISITAFITIAKSMSGSRHLKYLGQNSLSFFALHLAVGFPIILNIFAILNVNVGANATNIMGLIFVALTILLLIPVVKVLNTYFPIVLGNVEWKKKFKS
ncbi:Fucose 4-O-acetylase [Paenibacillus sp. UNCCL117]|uniref:acyltransferase family protein n=1 Tax=unclassified Paenibacillus TaxID=185978 RepID=UPI0008843A5C|nr:MULTISPECIES: acyltransferase family protein [unclassified Paenibacillus]SDD51404.1 Fucose 4-O-acetylase [Paenibacillus sp. cl123]SFW49523.1 Fucose 4-O-acetylase [Paenibacillus sp. UNCCL117]